MKRLAAALALGAALAAAPCIARTLVFCSEGNPRGFQPALYTDGTTFDASSRTIYDRLVEFKPGSTELEPGLATSWELSSDGRSYTFHLRRGVRFQSNAAFRPGRDFNADDVVFTFDRMANKANPYHQVSGGSYDYFLSMDLPRLLQRVVAVDPYTVRFDLAQPNAPFLADLAMDFASIGSAEYAAAMARAGRKSDFDRKPIGTGPFELLDFAPDSQVRFRAFDSYWRGRAPIDQLVFAITPDAAVRWAKLRAGECQIMAYPNPADLPAMAADPQVRLLERPGLNIGYLAFNVEKKPLGDARVRRALALAIDRKAIVSAVFGSAGKVADNPIPPTLWSWDRSVPGLAHDPATARKLLAEAGYPEGFSTDLWAMSTDRPYLPDPRRVAEMIQSDWASIGVRATIRTYEWGEYLKRLGQAEHQTALMGWISDNGDPDNFLGTLLSCAGVHTSQNVSEWCDKDYDALVDRARTSGDRAQRIADYAKAQQLFHRELPWVPLAHASNVVPVSARVRGFTVDAIGAHRFYGASLP